MQLIAQHGTPLAAEPRRCRGLLQDHLEGAYKREMMALLIALEHGIVQALADSVAGQRVELLLAQLTQRLLDQVPFDETAAFWAVESWALALGILTTPPLPSRPATQSGMRPAAAPRPTRPTPTPRLGSVELAVPLQDITVTLHGGDTVRGDVRHPLTIASALGGKLDIPAQELVSLDGARWLFADGTVLTGALTVDVLEVITPRRVRILQGDHVQPLRYQPTHVAGEEAAGLRLGTLQGDLISGHCDEPLTFQTAAETLELTADEILGFVDECLTLDDGTRLTGTFVAPDPLVVRTRYGILHVPLAQLHRLHHVLINTPGIAFVWIPAGEFRMGSDTGLGDEKPVHTVRISRPFYLSRLPLTQGQWQAVMGTNPSRFAGNLRCPVEQVSWKDTQDFIQRLHAGESGVTYRLPTEAEWEYAARAGSPAAYCFGDDELQLQHYAWYDQNAGGSTHPAGQLQPNAMGLYDMHGNVWEWVQDWYDNNAYKDRTTAGEPAGPPAGSDRVIRGGGGFGGAGSCRAARRSVADPGYRSGNLGFRLLREVP